ncbi:MAG: DNA/RNA helicase domain-containing protein [Dehalococcoidia bacterium]
MTGWTGSVALLQTACRELVGAHPPARTWHYFLEFDIPRRSRRIDVLILAEDVLFLLEWKVGAERFDAAAIWQAEQYALDLRDFHEASHHRVIVPIVVATRAPAGVQSDYEPGRLVQEVQRLTPDEIAGSMWHWWRRAHDPTRDAVDPATWEDSPYRPTPTIVDAATMLYEQNDVREIALSGSSNLDETVSAVLELIDFCRVEGRRGVVFITGAPGSGKTLAGLQIVHAPEMLRGKEAAGVFLSGNRPLVSVISAALVKSAQRSGKTKRQAESEVQTFIQHAYQFRNDNVKFPDRPPHEHVILFDEAQRAWDSRRVESWTKGALKASEPEIFLDIMSRWPDWAVVIALVGSGQEINTGESGLGEWGRAITAKHPDWLVRASPAVLPGATEPPGGRLLDELPPGLSIQADDRLHLRMNVRSPRAERLNEWVDRVLALDPDGARAAFPDPREYPMVMTRSLDAAREWMRQRATTAPDRSGLLISAEARRLRAWGLDGQVLQRERKWAEWFLAGRGDVRGSDHLEIAATNFDCQGLEIDWAGVVWGNDLVPQLGSWSARQFKGTRWQKANAERARYIVNGYRVILTRARRGQIICVPQPDGRDTTLPPEQFERIAELLARSGVPSID